MNETFQLQRLAHEDINRGRHAAGRDGESAGHEIESEAGHVGLAEPGPRRFVRAVGSRTG